MKRINFRVFLGALLILGGILGLLELLGVIPQASTFFWGIVSAVGALAFLYFFFSNRLHWWAAIPGFTLAGLAVACFLPVGIGWGGLAFLGGIGLSFFAVYIHDRGRWWALIPGGVMVTLGIVSLLSGQLKQGETGGVFFMGLGVTFLLVAVLANLRWAYIPCVVLLLVGLLVGVFTGGFITYAWVVALLLVGGVMIFQALRKK